MNIDAKEIKRKLKIYERNFKKDPDYRDGTGSRFLMGPYYLCLDDLEGAVSHYAWFWNKFSDSIDEPFHALGRIVTELRQEHEQNAQSLLKRLYAANPYLLSHILKMDIKGMEIPSHSSWEDKPYITNAPKELYSYLSCEEIGWFKQAWVEKEFSEFVEAYNNIQRALKNEPVGMVKIYRVLKPRENKKNTESGKI